MENYDFTGLKVMVIDDSATILRAAEIYINGPADKPTGIILEKEEIGFDAIDHIYEFRPHIIFLDVMMPKVEGFPLCKAIKDDPDLKGTAVIMLTSKDGMYNRALGADAGADAYISKPFVRDTIMQMLAKYAPPEFRKPS